MRDQRTWPDMDRGPRPGTQCGMWKQEIQRPRSPGNGGGKQVISPGCNMIEVKMPQGGEQGAIQRQSLGDGFGEEANKNNPVKRNLRGNRPVYGRRQPADGIRRPPVLQLPQRAHLISGILDRIAELCR
ncbi:hypothetical protein D3C74_417330 [compost metagenome]